MIPKGPYKPIDPGVEAAAFILNPTHKIEIRLHMIEIKANGKNE
jgi:hypothetical protein